jgi:pantoate--beta-alanine ligase
MYPREQLITVDPGPMGQVLEGASRPGFFTGVLTVVLKLFQLAQPQVAVFGEKDAQQLALVGRMAGDLDLGVQIASVPTVRDPDGLAVSSRNSYLSAAERRTALALPRALRAGREAQEAGPEAALKAAGAVLDEAATAAPPLVTDYLALADPDTFTPVAAGYAGEALLLAAVKVGGTRLIDNMQLVLGGQS